MAGVYQEIRVDVRRLQLKKPYLEGCEVDTTSSTGDDLTTYRIIIHRSMEALLRLCSGSSDYTRIKCYMRDLYKHEEFMHELADALKENEALTDLSFQSNNMRDAGAAALAELFQTNTTLRVFEVFANNLGPTGTAALANSLQNNTGLVTLNLSYNELVGDEGAIALAKMLEANKTLRILALEEDQVGDKGAIAIAKALEVNTSLTRLNLSFNYTISDDSAVAFAKSLGTNRCLTYLALKDNLISNDGAQALVNAVALNRTVTSLLLRERHLSKSLRRGLELSLLHNLETQRAAFIEALGSGEKAPWMRSKLMVVGEGMVGKTATVRSLLRKRFDKEWKSTVGVSLHEAKANERSVWQEDRAENFVDPLVRHMAVQKLGKETEPAKSIPKQKVEPVQSFTPVVPTTKVEAVARSLSMEESKEEERAEDRVMEFNDDTLAGAQTDDTKLRISVWDYGGQEVFYNLHHLFLTHFGCYLLVFNAHRLAQHPEESEAYLTFWMKSLRLHTNGAPLLLVGTFASDLDSPEDVTQVSTAVKDLAMRCRVDAIDHTGEGLSFFPIDNASGEGVEVLRSTIQEVLLAQEYVKFNVSVQWMQVLDEMQHGQRKWVALKEVQEIVRKFGGMPAAEVDSMLGLFHELGVVIHFTMTENLKQVVTTDAQWLVDCISKVVRDPSIHKFNSEAIAQVQLQEDLKMFLKSGLVSRDLLDFLWDNDQVDFLVDLMRRLLLLSHWRFTTEAQDHLYLVPGMIPETSHTDINPDRSQVKLEQVEEQRSGAWMEFDFEYLPIGVFERLVCLCVDYSTSMGSTMEPVLAKGHCKVWIKTDVALVITKTGDKVKASVMNMEHAAGALMIMLFMVKKIKTDVMGPRFEWTLHLQHNDAQVDYEEARRRKIEPWFVENGSEEHLGESGLDMNAFIGSL